MTFEEQGIEDEGTCEIMYVVFPIIPRLGSGILIGSLTLVLGLVILLGY